jgi:hypothetical protein
MRRVGSRTRRTLYSGIDMPYRFRYTEFDFDQRGKTGVWPGPGRSGGLHVTPDWQVRSAAGPSVFPVRVRGTTSPINCCTASQV